MKIDSKQEIETYNFLVTLNIIDLAGKQFLILFCKQARRDVFNIKYICNAYMLFQKFLIKSKLCLRMQLHYVYLSHDIR